MLSLYYNGILIGFLIAAPVGPVGAMCVRQTLVRGRLHGLFAGLGAAIADSIFGVVAAFGLTSISSLAMEYQNEIRIAGVIAMLGLGLRILLSHRHPDEEAEAADRRSRSHSNTGTFLATFVLTLTNPVTILAFAGIFAAFGVLHEDTTLTEASVLVGGVFSGSAAWWIALALLAGLMHGNLNPRSMRWINRLTGALLLVFALLVSLSLIQPGLIPFLDPPKQEEESAPPATSADDASACLPPLAVDGEMRLS